MAVPLLRRTSHHHCCKLSCSGEAEATISSSPRTAVSTIPPPDDGALRSQLNGTLSLTRTCAPSGQLAALDGTLVGVGAPGVGVEEGTGVGVGTNGSIEFCSR